MLRRCACIVALVAVIAAPAVTSTRLFCRYTGEEIVGCDEAASPAQAIVRGADCCDQMTVHAVRGATAAGRQWLVLGQALVAIEVAPELFSRAFSGEPPAADAAPSVGPPAFLSHRALLI